ncbi:alpha-mannosidase 2C1-like [Limulus polyphemus]|uniref:Alpha-mannosidase 2C1-like n=1 Tax=Limulus polyphemus TaxID=6850 RepID=A0ABM1T7F5_LIMPO|nr:alpha-mannosidase 2C1-like [Limulus polyphemus]
MQDAGDEKTTLVPVVVNPFGYQVLRGISAVKVPVTADRRSDGSVCLKNQFLVAIVNHQGEVTSLQLLEKPRELISVGQVGNKLVMFDDIPLYWDAWDVMDYHLETKRSAINKVIHPLTIIRKGPLEVKLEMSAKVGDHSELKQTLTLDAVHPYLKFDIDISWFESHKFLKVEFPVNILANQATYEIQFGHLQRPTHFNTSWDWAKYEVCGHKWVTLSEYDCGVALLNTNKYGHAVHGSTMRISLLRSSKSPDSKADMRCHQFTYALMPYNGTFQSAGVIQQAYQLNSPIQVFHTSATSGLKIDMSVPNPVVLLDKHESMSWFQVEKEAVIIETLKKSENHENCLVIRLYESYGSHVTTSILSLLQIVKAILCDGLENPLPKNDIHWSDGKMTLSFKPFQLISVLLFLKSNI